MDQILSWGPEALIVYGGSFNPPHVGHVLFASYLRQLFPEAELWLVPSYRHAFDKSLLPFEERMSLLELACASISGLTLSDIETRLEGERSYSIVLVRKLKQLYPNRKIVLAVGADVALELHRWKEIEELRRLATFLIFPRQGYVCEEALALLPLPEISSSELRLALASGRKLEPRLAGLLPTAVRLALEKAQSYRQR